MLAWLQRSRAERSLSTARHERCRQRAAYWHSTASQRSRPSDFRRSRLRISSPRSGLRGASESKQPLGIAVIDHVAMRRWAIEPVNELRRHLVGAERMVGPEQQVLRTEYLVATSKRLVVIAHGVNVKVGDIVADRSRKARRFGDERGGAAIGFDAALQIGQHSAGMCHDEREGRMFVENAAVNEAQRVQAGVVRKPDRQRKAGAVQAGLPERHGRMQVNRHSQSTDMCCSTGRCSAASSILPAMLENSWIPLKPSWVMHRSTSAMARCGFPNPIVPKPTNLPGQAAMMRARSSLIRIAQSSAATPPRTSGPRGSPWLRTDTAMSMASRSRSFASISIILGSAGTRKPAAHSTA